MEKVNLSFALFRSQRESPRLMVMIIIGDASSFRVIIPTRAVRSISGKESLKCFSRGWLAWAGPAKKLYYDAAKGHITNAFAGIGDKYNMLMRPVPAEAAHLKDVWRRRWTSSRTTSRGSTRRCS